MKITVKQLKRVIREAAESDSESDERRDSDEIAGEAITHLERASELINELANAAIASSDGPHLVDKADSAVTRAIDCLERAVKMGHFE